MRRRAETRIPGRESCSSPDSSRPNLQVLTPRSPTTPVARNCCSDIFVTNS